MATKGIRDGATRAADGRKGRRRRGLVRIHGDKTLLHGSVRSSTRIRQERRLCVVASAVVRHQGGDTVGPCVIWVRLVPLKRISVFRCALLSRIISQFT